MDEARETTPQHQRRNFFDSLFWTRQRHGSGERFRISVGQPLTDSPAPARSASDCPSGASPPPRSNPTGSAWGSAYAKCYARRQEKCKRNEEAMANYQGKIPKIEQLFKAIQQGNVETVRDLVKKDGVDVNARFVGGSHPLASAVVCSQKEIVRLLVERGADCNKKDGTGTTPLHLSVQWNWVSDSVIIDILLEGKADPNIFNEHGETPLHSAIKRHRKAHVQKFLQRGGNPNKGVLPSGKTPVMLASESGQLDILRCLIETYGADLQLRDKSGNTILHYAALSGHGPIVEFLLDKGVLPNVTNCEKVSPIKVAVSKGHAEVVALLLSHGAGISLQHRELLFAAAKSRSAEILRLLFLYGARASSELVFFALEECLAGGDHRGWITVFQILLQATGCLEPTESNDDILYRACLKASQLRSAGPDSLHPDDADDAPDSPTALPALSKIVLLVAIAGYPFTQRVLIASRVEDDPFDDSDVSAFDEFPFPSLHRSLVFLLYERPRSLKQLACLNVRHSASHISNVFHFSLKLPLPKLIKQNVVDLCESLLIN